MHSDCARRFALRLPPGPNLDAILRGGSTHPPARDFPRAGCLLGAAGNRPVRLGEWLPNPVHPRARLSHPSLNGPRIHSIGNAFACGFLRGGCRFYFFSALLAIVARDIPILYQ